MKPTLIVCLLAVLSATAVTRQPIGLIAFHQTPTAAPSPEGPMGQTEIDLVKWAVNQGGLTAVLLAVLWSYRRDFFRKQEATKSEIDARQQAKQTEIDVLREEKRMLGLVIDKNSAAMTQQALAVQANTDATRQLAANVMTLADRRRQDRE